MTAERNIFEISAGRAGIHGATKRRIATIDHFFYIFDDGVTRMLNINHFLKMVFKNFLPRLLPGDKLLLLSDNEEELRHTLAQLGIEEYTLRRN